MSKSNGSFYKFLAVFTALNVLNSVVFPTAALALTGGPSQPEVESFSPIGTSDMVDVFSGDFKYNIPLLDVGGYPLNIAYNPGSGPDTEASFVGLGWNINPGVIGRSVRGLPDDFKGDRIKREYNVKGQQSFGVTFSPDFEFFAVGGEELGKVAEKSGAKVKFSTGVSYNNYTGVGFEFGMNPTIKSGQFGKTKYDYNLGLNFNLSSSSGVSVSPSLSFYKKVADEEDKSIYTMKGGGVGLSINSRQGFQTLTLNRINDTYKQKDLKQKDFYKDAMTGSKSIGAALTFNTPTYTPKQDMPMINVGGTMSLNLGPEIFGGQGEFGTSAYYSGQFLARKEQESKSYGYLYSEKSTKFGVHDFNRENDGGYSKHTPNLPVTNYTYDVYSVSGQGLGGTFRPFRNDIGVLHDQRKGGLGSSGGNSGGTDVNVGVGAEFGMGQLTKWGVNINATVVNTYSGDWNMLNFLSKNIDFKSASYNTNEETYFFKQAGELHVDKDFQIFHDLGGYDAIEPDVNTALMAGMATGLASDEKGNVYRLFHSNVSRDNRRNRNQAMKITTADKAQFSAVTKLIESYESGEHIMDALGQYVLGQTGENRVEDFRKSHHISEISVIRPDGVIYVYGIPAYNTYKEEVTMAVNREGDCSTGLVSYTATENSVNNESGSDHFYDKQVTPGFAHSFLLTAVVSPDYVDVTGDGPTDDDLGTYTKFNYSKTIEGYKWRVPFEPNSANYSEGLKSRNSNANGHKSSDNKGSYTYGEKEVWYVHSIVTKNYVAEFYLSDRKDGYEVSGKDGGFGQRSLQKLDRIELYSKAERLTEGSDASPLKVVHFEYDYSLCPGIPNNIDNSGGGKDGGKLTLKRLYFTYENSNKAILNSYRFNYSKFNPSYDIKAYDRWGNYKPESATSCDVNGVLSNSEFPYAEQNSDLADKYASAWNLDEILLPSGGRIKVSYEADDYAYVQNKRANQMFKILGAGDNQTPNIYGSGSSVDIGSENLFVNGTQARPYDYLYFKLKNPISGTKSQADNIVHEKYLKGIENLYFRFLLNIDNKGAYEYVSGYLDPENVGVIDVPAGKNTNGDFLYGFIKVKTVDLENSSILSSGFLSGDINPISKAGWNFTRKNLPKVAYGQPDIDANGITQFITAIGSTIEQLAQFLAGFNRVLKQQNFSRKFVRGKSWVRLNEPAGYKIGGGSRVSKVEMSDEWNALSGIDDTFNYGQEYQYTKTEYFAGKKQTISSGVACYEPMAGSDENPFKQPIFYGKDNLLAPDDENYAEEPIGESFFPGASVGYSEVTVKDLTRDGVTKNATGKVVHEFYTAKDYPTITRRTTPNPKQNIAGKIFSFLKLNNWDHLAVSQGFVVELNDMHGKQKKQTVYPESGDSPISSVEYFYKSGPLDKNASDEKLIELNEQSSNSETKRLANKADVIYKYQQDGRRIRNQVIGVDYDIVADMIRSETVTVGGGISFNADGFLVTFVPVVIPIPLPKVNFEHTGYYQATITKVINKYSLLEKTVARDLGSEVSTENLLYDAETGEVLLTKTVNQYDDPVYNFTYPAHWAYDRMGMAYENLGYTLKNMTLTGMTTEQAKWFNLTDELVLIDQNGIGTKVWVTGELSNGITVIDRNGNTDFTGEYTIVVNRSGKRNMHTTPVGTVTTLTDPRVDIDGDKQYDKLVFENVLNAGMTEFTDEWKVNCNCGLNGGEANEFLNGTIGSWRPLKSWVYLTDRTKTLQNNNTNVRKDGVFEQYSDFWRPSTTSNSDWTPNRTGWQFTTEVSFFNMHGLELENRDALDRYSSALYGFYFSLPKAVANNSEVSEVAFDSFEDYLPEDCEDDHFSYRAYSDKISNEESHSGRRSIRLDAGEEINVRKVIKPCD